ncbi:MAG: glutamate synthase subunit beta [Coriobacteriales bacterium]|nr:glutamate synthase subunit beta [Coriobacteriales bacterium]
MGKAGAFLQVGRSEHGMREVAESLADYAELAIPLSADKQREQASRCMYCGVAFCQTGMRFGNNKPSGCPLHNLIPEWNDLLYRGQWESAAARLSLTNPFPEFTGRVCPAPCEAACNLGLNDKPTTIRDNERAISDFAWDQGKIAPLAKAARDAPRVAVVGSGPSGMACAWELARRGARVTLVERDDRMGGLLMYGIPNMKLPKDVVARRVELMAKSGIELRCGVDASDPQVAQELRATHDALVAAVGARKARVLRVPGADLDGVVMAVDYLTGVTKALLDGGVPAVDAADKDVVVIGGGDTGTDCVATAVRQGAKSVRQLEFLPEPPARRVKGNEWPAWPNVRKDDYGQLEASFVFGGDPRMWATETLEILGRDGQVCGLRVVPLDWTSGSPVRLDGQEQTLPCQLVLVAMGFEGADKSVLEALGAGTDPRVFVAGDARKGPSLVVSAIADGLACAEEVAAKLGL